MSDNAIKPIPAEFKLILFTILGLNLLFLAVICILSFGFQDPLSVPQKNLFELCSTCLKMGFGAIIGLIGGKAA